MGQMSGDGSTNIYTLKNPAQYELKGNNNSFFSQYLSFQLKKCNSVTSEVPCADFGANEEKLIEYVSAHNLVILQASSFIDYDEVDPFKGPLMYNVSIFEALNGKQLIMGEENTVYNTKVFSYVEHRVSLQDSLIQLFSDPEEFSLLIIDKSEVTTGKILGDLGDLFFEFRFDLSTKIQIEKRQVTSFPTLFGNLGGIYSFFATMVLCVINRYQTGAYGLHQVNSLFKQLPSSNNVIPKFGCPDLSMRKKVFRPINQGIFLQLRLIYWPCCCLIANKRDRYMR